jgi:hypothetical protein
MIVELGVEEGGVYGNRRKGEKRNARENSTLGVRTDEERLE